MLAGLSGYLPTQQYLLAKLGVWGDTPAMAYGPRLHKEGAWIALIAARLCAPDFNLLTALIVVSYLSLNTTA